MQCRTFCFRGSVGQFDWVGLGRWLCGAGLVGLLVGGRCQVLDLGGACQRSVVGVRGKGGALAVVSYWVGLGVLQWVQWGG